MAVAEPEEQLAWEARQRPRAGIAALAGGVLLIAGFVWRSVALGDAPNAGYLESLGRAAESGPIGEQTSLRIATYEYLDDRTLAIVGPAITLGIAYVALGWAVTFLAHATRARRPEFIRLAVYMPIVGATLAGVAQAAGGIGTSTAIADFLDGPRTVDAARDIGGGSVLLTAEILSQFGPLVLVAGLFLVALNAMRVGLLTRFLGFLGIMAAVLTIIPLVPASPLQAAWLISVGLVFLGLLPGGLPPAWRTGRAEPWQTAMQGAQRRRAAEDRKQGIRRDPEPEPQPVPAGRPHPSSKKRKRKRRG